MGFNSGIALQDSGHTKVCDFAVVLHIQHYIVRLDVSMNDFLGVQILNANQHFSTVSFGYLMPGGINRSTAKIV
jgi:hypothetical protein